VERVPVVRLPTEFLIELDGNVARYGPLAQLVAHLHDTQGVVGSSPARPTRKPWSDGLRDPRCVPSRL